MALEQIGRQPHGSTTDEDMMGQPIADNPEALFKAHDAELEASVARAELRNANALADKLQTLLDSKTHQVKALHVEMEHTRRANELIADSAKRWQARCEEADRTIDAMLEILRPHAAPVFDEAGTPLDAARYVVSRITTDPEPDMDTVPLADLLDAVGTFLEEGQGIRISRLHHGVTDMRVYALGLEFAVESHEASETLTHAHELAQCRVEG